MTFQKPRILTDSESNTIRGKCLIGHATREQRLQEAQAEIKRLHKLFCDLTPGGSEFAQDPDYCAKYLHQKLETQGELLKKKVIALRQREAELEQREADILRYVEAVKDWRKSMMNATNKPNGALLVALLESARPEWPMPAISERGERSTI